MPLNYKAIRKIPRDIHHDAQFATGLAYGDHAIIHNLLKEFASDGVTINLAAIDEYDTERQRFYKEYINAVLTAIRDAVDEENSNAV